MKKSKAIRAREIIVKAMDGEIDDTEALEVPNLFNLWSGDSYSYKANTRVRYEGNLYRCIMDHISQPTWNPASAPSLWAKVLIPDENIIPDWEQPNSTNGYSYGDKVKHNDIVWISIYEGSNVWEPGAVGTENMWKKYEEDSSTEEDGGESESGGESTNEGSENNGDDSGSSTEGDIPAWVQPDSTNPYQIGDNVKHNEAIWESNVANNVWEPGVYGWTKIV